jgi:hypothetical protein
MAHARQEFTDSQKAAIYARDRATCCFSGANLWLLDAPLRVGWQSDWVDHVSPKSRGGEATLANGACASHTYNMKKRNNSADTTYLFKGGQPTPLYHELFGVPDALVSNRLQRLSRLEDVDWYFNRTITWILEALNDQWDKPGYKRTDEYWFKAADKKLNTYRKIQDNVPSLEQRGIMTDPSETQEILLSIRQCDSLTLMKKHVLPPSSQYRRNSQAWWDYFHPETYVDSAKDYDSHRKKAFKRASKIQDQLTTDNFACIQSDFEHRYGSK